MFAIAAFFIGLLFGTGLCLSSMINPNKILNFLNVFGAWDPTLLVVIGSALLTTFIGYRIVFRVQRPILAEKFFLPEQTKLTKSLIFGSMIFGIGWGATGYCPGPAITALSTFNMDPIYFVIGMVLGSLSYWWFYVCDS